MIIGLMLFIFHIGAINYVHGMIAFGMFAIFLYQPYKRGRLALNAFWYSEIWTLVLFGVMYVLFGEISTMHLEYYLIAPVLVFLAGWVCCECSKDSLKTINTAIFAILLGYGVHITLNMSISIGNSRLEMRDFFQGIRIATGLGPLNTMIFSLAAYAMFIEGNKTKRLVLLMLLGISGIYSFMLGTRSQIAVLIVVFVIIINLYMYEKDGVTGLVKALRKMVFVIGIMMIAYMMNLFGIRTMIEKSNLLLRYAVTLHSRTAEANVSAELRLKLLMGAFEGIAKMPFGGNKSATYYHNMLLDIARISGVIPMFLMIAYMMRVLSHLRNIYRCKELANMRFMILSVYMGFWINFMVEPVLEGFLDYFLMMCLLDGMVTYVVHRVIPKTNKNRITRPKGIEMNANCHY